MLQNGTPGKPSIIPEECSAENNSVTIAWQPHIGNAVESYSLELDDGNGGPLKIIKIINFYKGTLLNVNPLFYGPCRTFYRFSSAFKSCQTKIFQDILTNLISGRVKGFLKPFSREKLFIIWFNTAFSCEKLLRCWEKLMII
ncbi:hypothetical protein KUTeg_013940 [Tegillarca granosa]|uniref:Fibronectin type-III domain-containing protein n=1 Tax=Tegillarca granosa TaxID=220873 RepID=A0ABQ9EV51_TEGGR|nr:hypothetical protein KUTeg_013940 [Tegillarca granosa]